MKVHAHTLLYSINEPAWLTGCEEMTNNPLDCKTPYKSDQLKQILQYHIQTVLKYYNEYYPRLIVTWDLANELAYNSNFPSRHSVFEKIIDPETGENSYTYYLVLASQYAMAASPQVRLCINENSFEDTDGARAELVYEFVQVLQKRESICPASVLKCTNPSRVTRAFLR